MDTSQTHKPATKLSDCHQLEARAWPASWSLQTGCSGQHQIGLMLGYHRPWLACVCRANYLRDSPLLPLSPPTSFSCSLVYLQKSANNNSNNLDLGLDLELELGNSDSSEDLVPSWDEKSFNSKLLQCYKAGPSSACPQSPRESETRTMGTIKRTGRRGLKQVTTQARIVVGRLELARSELVRGTDNCVSSWGDEWWWIE